jgi:hypothetical protein
MFSNNQITQIRNIFKEIKDEDEFEVMFNNYKIDNKLSILKFMDALKYIKYRSDNDKLELENQIILDIIYDYEINNFYRVSIKGLKNINDFLNLVHQRPNHVIFSILLTQGEFLENKDFVYIRKQKDVKFIYDIDQYDLRFRKSSETRITEKEINKILNLGLSPSSKISYRYKNRLSLKIIDTEKEKLSIDLTTIQFSNNVNNLNSINKKYELEIDYSVSKNGKVKLEDILKEVEMMKKVIDSTSNIITKEEAAIVIEAYKKLVFINDHNVTMLYSMNPISTEIQHIIDKIPNKYCVTDKADGNKYVLFVCNTIIYLISNNLEVTKTKYTYNINNTILEGELIHLIDEQKYLFMIYDCQFYDNIDVRNEINFKTRLNYVYKLCTGLNKKIYEFKDYDESFSFTKQTEFYKKQIKNFYDNLFENINKIEKNEIFFHPKFFIFPLGSDNSEVYNFSKIIWDYFNSNKCPYLLDGIIYNGIEQKYTRDKSEQKYPIYKYKPPDTNSIDVYINFQRDTETNNYLDIYDNTLGFQKDKTFRIVHFYVGEFIGTKEIPVLFMKEENNYEAYLPLVDGTILDIEGNFVQDNTVVEVVYNNDSNIPHPFRWTILRTRWDKTDSVFKYQKKYGNAKDVAVRIWKSINEAVTMEDMKLLGSPDTYAKQLKVLQLKLSKTVIVSDRQQDIYYQKISNLAKKMRDFHNWVKSILIYTYCSETSEFKDSNPIKNTVLDIGCGRGGDIEKWFHSRIKELVGIDPDYYNMFSSTVGAIARYNERKKIYPQFYKATWIQATGTTLFNSESQKIKFPNMTNDNYSLIDKTFKNKQFDIISSQFAIHYLFDSEESVNNLIKNITNHLKLGGYVIFTLFDANQIMNKLNDTDIFTSYYTDEDGIRRKFFEVIKKFDGKLKNETGLAIDVHMSWIMEENKYETEYLITPELLNKVMLKAGCVLIESDLFINLYNLNKNWFLNVIDHEENPKNYKFYKRSSEFFGDLKGADKESKMFSFLNRYYIYKKIN